MTTPKLSILAAICALSHLLLVADCSTAIGQENKSLPPPSSRQQELWEIVSSPTFTRLGPASLVWETYSDEEIASNVSLWLSDPSIVSERDLRCSLYTLVADQRIEFSETKFQILSGGSNDEDSFIAQMCMKALLDAPVDYVERVNVALLGYIGSTLTTEHQYFVILKHVWTSRFSLSPEVSESIRLNVLKDLSNPDLVQFSTRALLVSGDLRDFSMLANSVTQQESIIAVLRGIHEARIVIRDTDRASILAAKPTKDFVISCLDHPEAEVRRLAIWNSISTLGPDSHVDSPEQRAKNKALRDKYLEILSKETNADVRELLEVYMLPAINEDGTLPDRSRGR